MDTAKKRDVGVVIRPRCSHAQPPTPERESGEPNRRWRPSPPQGGRPIPVVGGAEIRNRGQAGAYGDAPL
jgi:hypothetical protein